jgi:hypothetical protein
MEKDLMSLAGLLSKIKALRPADVTWVASDPREREKNDLKTLTDLLLFFEEDPIKWQRWSERYNWDNYSPETQRETMEGRAAAILKALGR